MPLQKITLLRPPALGALVLPPTALQDTRQRLACPQGEPTHASSSPLRKGKHDEQAFLSFILKSYLLHGQIDTDTVLGDL